MSSLFFSTVCKSWCFGFILSYILLACFSCCCVAYMILRLGNSWLHTVKWYLILAGVMRMDWHCYDSVFTAAFYLKMICVNLANMSWGLRQTSNYLSWIMITKDNRCKNVQTLQSQNLIPDFPPNPSISFSKYMLSNTFLLSYCTVTCSALPPET